MEIKLLDSPFPHVIINDCYSQEELEDIKLELKFLSKPNKLMVSGIMHGGCGGTTHKAILLEETYSNRKISDILTIFDKKYSKELVDQIVEKFPSFIKLKFINSKITKLRYYFDGEKYSAHTDTSRDFIALSFFHSNPKKFTGGEIHFTDYDYTVECSDNTYILFPFYIKHEVFEVKISNDEYYNGNGRYCVSQFLDVIPNIFDKRLIKSM
jgi:hypothetical protein